MKAEERAVSEPKGITAKEREWLKTPHSPDLAGVAADLAPRLLDALEASEARVATLEAELREARSFTRIAEGEVERLTREREGLAADLDLVRRGLDVAACRPGTVHARLKELRERASERRDTIGRLECEQDALRAALIAAADALNTAMLDIRRVAVGSRPEVEALRACNDAYHAARAAAAHREREYVRGPIGAPVCAGCGLESVVCARDPCETATPRVEAGAGSGAVDGGPGPSTIVPRSVPHGAAPDQGAALAALRQAREALSRTVRREALAAIDAALAGAQEEVMPPDTAVQLQRDRRSPVGLPGESACAAVAPGAVSVDAAPTPPPAAQGPRCRICGYGEGMHIGSLAQGPGHTFEPAAPAREGFAERVKRFRATTGALSGGAGHPDRCVCQDGPDAFPGTPHVHRAEPPHGCARCECDRYRPAEAGARGPAPEQASGERCAQDMECPNVNATILAVRDADTLRAERDAARHALEMLFLEESETDPGKLACSHCGGPWTHETEDGYEPCQVAVGLGIAAPPPAGEPEQASGERCRCEHDGRDHAHYDGGGPCLAPGCGCRGWVDAAPPPAGEGTREQEAAAGTGAGNAARAECIPEDAGTTPGHRVPSQPPRFTDTREGEGCSTGSDASCSTAATGAASSPSAASGATSAAAPDDPSGDTALVLRALDWVRDDPQADTDTERACRALAARLRAGRVRAVEASYVYDLHSRLAAAEERTRAAEQDGNALRRQLVALQNAVGGDGTPDALHRKLAMAVAEARAEERAEAARLSRARKGA